MPRKKKTAAKKSTPKSDKPVTKAAFVRSLPKDMPAKEIVELAQEKGLKMEAKYVYEVRGAAKKSKASKKAKTAKNAAPAKKSAKVATAKSKTGAKPTASAFIRTLPATTPVADVVKQGAAKGYRFAANLVYAVRSAATKKKTAKAKPGPKPAAQRKANGAGSGSVEARFVDLALDVGLARAEELLAMLRAKLKSIVL